MKKKMMETQKLKSKIKEINDNCFELSKNVLVLVNDVVALIDVQMIINLNECCRHLNLGNETIKFRRGNEREIKE